MRSVIRPALVGIAAVGMAFAGAASASACGHDDPASINVHKTEIENSGNDYFSHNFNNNFNFGGNTVVFGDQEVAADED